MAIDLLASTPLFARAIWPVSVSSTVRREMSDHRLVGLPSPSVRRGQTPHRIVINKGPRMHELVLGRARAMDLSAHAEQRPRHPDMAHVRPGAQGEIVWQFDQTGEFLFACQVPGHVEAGRVGCVRVGSQR